LDSFRNPGFAGHASKADKELSNAIFLHAGINISPDSVFHFAESHPAD
jgi:hypothetical protein